MAEKTEQPTAKRLRDARKKGEVPFSKEAASALVILSMFVLLATSLPTIVQHLRRMLLLPVAFLNESAPVAGEQVLRGLLSNAAGVLLPFLIICVAGGAAGAILQFGLLLSGEHAKPSLKKLNPAGWFKKTFGVGNLMEFLKSLVKIILLGVIVAFLVSDGMAAIVQMPRCGVECTRDLLGTMLHQMMIWSAVPIALVAAIDFGWQRYQFTKKHMMTKDEVKREYKESEGDPQIKGMRKQLHQQLLAEGKITQARQATMLITNPTHVAVAIRYDEDETPLPFVTAIGTDLVARRMIEAATQAGVPVMQDILLARALLEDASIDQYIPSALIEPFAEVLRALQELRRDVGDGPLNG